MGIERTSDQDSLISIYKQSNVLLSLSSAETFGLTIVEANACGIPAIVYDNTAPPSLISERTGYVVENKNVEAVYKKIQVVRKNGSDYYRGACIDNVKIYYDKNRNYQKYVNLYEELLSR